MMRLFIHPPWLFPARLAFLSLLLLLGGSLPWASAQAPRELTDLFGETREALALAHLPTFRSTLQRFSDLYQRTRPSLSETDRAQYDLWLLHFHFLRFQMEGALPPILDTRDFLSLAALQEHIQRFDACIQALQKAFDFLRKYNALYTKLAARDNLQAQIILQASLSLERDTDILVRQSQIYVAFLRFAQDHWNDRQNLKRRLDSHSRSLDALRSQQRKARAERSLLESEQKKLALSVQKAQKQYKTLYDDLQSRHSKATLTIIFGSVILALGATSTLFGGLLLHDRGVAENTKNYPSGVFQETRDLEKNGNGDWRDFLAVGSVSFLAGGGGLSAIGIALIVVGVVNRPKPSEAARPALRSHETFLKDHAKETSHLQKNKHFRQKASLLFSAN